MQRGDTVIAIIFESHYPATINRKEIVSYTIR